MPSDATCFLRTGYVVQGKGPRNHYQRGTVIKHTALTALLRTDDGKKMDVDQFAHDWEVVYTNMRDSRSLSISDLEARRQDGYTL